MKERDIPDIRAYDDLADYKDHKDLRRELRERFAYYYDDRFPRPIEKSNMECFRDNGIGLIKIALKFMKGPLSIRFLKLGDMYEELISRILFGVGVESLLKSFYLKRGYSINYTLKNGKTMLSFPKKFDNIVVLNKSEAKKQRIQARVAGFGMLVDNIDKILNWENVEEIKIWLTVIEQWRHSHIHIGTIWGIESFRNDRNEKRHITLFEDTVKVINCLIEEFFGREYVVS
jgi:hypothetical protein